MSICTGCYTHDNSVEYREKYGKKLCNGCSRIAFKNMCKIMDVKEHWARLKRMYKKIGEEYLHDETENPLEAYKRLSQLDDYGITLWHEEVFTAEMYISHKINEQFDEIDDAETFYESLKHVNSDDESARFIYFYY